MIARIVRVEMTSQGALGILLLDNEAFCCTLEPDISETGKLYIAPGTYDCPRFHGTKWKDTFEIKVPGHTAVLFHSGNTEADTLGCILLGASFGKLKGQRAVLNSGETFNTFLSLTKNLAQFTLTIQDQYCNIKEA